MRRVLLAVSLIVSFTASALAVGNMSDNWPRYRTGDEFYKNCFIAAGGESASTNTITTYINAIAYIEGVYDTIQAAGSGGYHICAPDGVMPRQLYDITCNGLRDHPQDRQVSAAILTYNYLQAAFPCVEVKQVPNTVPPASAPPLNTSPSSIPPAITLPEAPILQDMSHNCEVRGGRFDVRSRLCSGITESACASMGGVWRTHLIGNADCEFPR